MDVVTHLLILIGIGCLVMGGILLSQDPILIKERVTEIVEEKVTEEHGQRSFETIEPVTKKSDRIWMQDTREQHNQVRPYPVF